MNGEPTHHDLHYTQPMLQAGVGLTGASYALVLLHGRGGTPEGMLPLVRAAGAVDGSALALRAAGGSWYPNRFLAPLDQNEPYLSHALTAIGNAFDYLEQQGISPDRTLLVGFSQDACLSLEYVARTPRRYGGVAALAGGLMGADDDRRSFSGTLSDTPVLIACGDVDEHIPESRVHAAANVMTELGARTDVRIYPDIGHTIVGDQIDALKAMVDAIRATIPAG